MIDQNTNHMEYQPGMEQIGSEIQDAVISKMKECDFDSYTAADVRRALQKDVLSPDDFAALLSPAADSFLGKWHTGLSRKPASTSAIR